MSSITIEGGKPLVGEVSVSGAKNAASKMIFAALFSNEDIVLDNVPHITPIEQDIALVLALGGKAEWIGQNTLSLNGSGINIYEVPVELGSKTRMTMLLAGPLLYRFGKAALPKFKSSDDKSHPVNRFLTTWKSLGVEVHEDENYYYLLADNAVPTNINFKNPTHMGTDNAILSSIFLPGETVIEGSSEEAEVDDLIQFCNVMGCDVKRTEPKRIVINGTNIFHGGSYSVMYDKDEAVALAGLAIVTNGNILIRNVVREPLIPYVNFLTKVGIRFEFVDNGLKIWHDGSEINPVQITFTPSPGLLPHWKPLISLILSMANGESILHDAVYLDRDSYVSDLNRMGGKYELAKPSDVNLGAFVSDDSYDMDILGEPQSVIRVSGPCKLKGTKLFINDAYSGVLFLAAALGAEGKTTLGGTEYIGYHFENFIDKVISLGGRILQNEPTN